MSGVRTTTRLEALYALRRRTDHEVASARRRGDRGDLGRLLVLLERVDEEIKAEGGKVPPRPKGQRRTRREKATDRVSKRLEQLGVTAHDVKVWAVSVGLVDQVHRGRIRSELVEAWASRCECEATDASTAVYHGGCATACPRERADHGPVIASPALCLPCLHGCCD